MKTCPCAHHGFLDIGLINPENSRYTCQCCSDKNSITSSRLIMQQIPPFEALPLRKDGPPGNAWGLFGDDDQLGRLNFLTPAVVKSAASEIQTGTRVSLDWDLDKPKVPGYGSQTFRHQIINKAPSTENDDAVAFNTQGGSQWDGLRHFGKSLPSTYNLRTYILRQSKAIKVTIHSTMDEHRKILKRMIIWESIVRIPVSVKKLPGRLWLTVCESGLRMVALLVAVSSLTGQIGQQGTASTQIHSVQPRLSSNISNASWKNVTLSFGEVTSYSSESASRKPMTSSRPKNSGIFLSGRTQTS